MAHAKAGTFIAALGVAIVVAACGGDSETPDASGAATTAPGATAKGGVCEPGSGSTVTVEIPEFTFDPTPVKVDRCDSVVWKNTHNQAHTSSGDGAMKWSTGSIAPGSAAPEAIQFSDPGTFTYICALHPFMKGEVTVAG